MQTACQRRVAQLTGQGNCVYFSFWKFIMYINILKILRRTAVNITCFKPGNFDISQLLAPLNPLPSLLLSFVVTLTSPSGTFGRNTVDTAHSPSAASVLRLNHPFFSLFCLSVLLPSLPQCRHLIL